MVMSQVHCLCLTKNIKSIYFWYYGGPEGVLAAAALDALGCYFQGKFLFDTEESINRAKTMGITDINKKYEIKDIIKGDSIFCATGITSGDLVKWSINKRK